MCAVRRGPGESLGDAEAWGNNHVDGSIGKRGQEKSGDWIWGSEVGVSGSLWFVLRSKESLKS